MTPNSTADAPKTIRPYNAVFMQETVTPSHRNSCFPGLRPYDALGSYRTLRGYARDVDVPNGAKISSGAPQSQRGSNARAVVRTDPLRPSQRSFLLGCFFGPCAFEDVFHGVVAFVTGVLEQQFVDPGHGHGGGPGSRKRRGIIEGIAVV